ncbi:MAG: sigma-70 family RNA polymerase sigma factor [Firmicutes bacterium]|nr:sigma-70 family RNA polymerase sigma factor [Bacillota bacterium]
MTGAPDEDLFARLAGGDAAAREELVARHMGLVHHVVRRFPGAADPEDLVQAGVLGLIQALSRFDPHRGASFSSFAVPYILGEVRACFHRQQSGAHVGRAAARLAQRARATAAQLTQTLGREPSLRELAAALDVDATDLAQLLDAQKPAASVEASPEEDEDAAPAAAAAEPSFESEWIERYTLREVLARLEERDRRLIALRYLAGLSQAEVGRRLGVSQVQVSRLERRILAQLRGAAEP